MKDFDACFDSPEELGKALFMRRLPDMTYEELRESVDRAESWSEYAYENLLYEFVEEGEDGRIYVQW